MKKKYITRAGAVLLYMGVFACGTVLMQSCSTSDDEQLPLVLTPQETRTVSIVFSDGTASVTIPSGLEGVSYAVEGAHVTVTSTNVTQEVTYHLSGSAVEGSFTLNGSYKCTLLLDGLQLTSAVGPALDIECGKRIALELAAGSENRLEDTAGGTHKAALYCRGHLELDGDGALSVIGHTAHAIATKEYLLLKKGMGALTVQSDVKDGIHAGQYFRMNGGVVTATEVAGDAIQVEATSDATDVYNGEMQIRGGSIQLTLNAQDSKGLKCDGMFTVSGGEMEIRANGNGSRGIQTAGDMVVQRGDGEVPLMRVYAAGGRCTVSEDAGDPHRCMGIKVEGNLTVADGTVYVENTGRKSRAIRVYGTYLHTGGDVTGTVDNRPKSEEE